MISHKIAVHQLIDVCTTAVERAHNSCCATDEPISSEDIP